MRAFLNHLELIHACGIVHIIYIHIYIILCKCVKDDLEMSKKEHTREKLPKACIEMQGQ